jgi:hypothetical protein
MSAITALSQISENLPQIDSPVDLGYHPDTVFSVFDFFTIHIGQMKTSGIKDKTFAAIRYAPVKQYELTQAKVECIYLRIIDGKATLLKSGNPVSEAEVKTFTQLAKGEEVEFDGQKWKRI